MEFSRSSGVLLHITSLPGRFGIGDLGPAAFAFADFLQETNQRYWQVLPLNPVGPGASPYSSPSTFAGNPLLISPERLHENGLLTKKDLQDAATEESATVDFSTAIPAKQKLLEEAFARFEDGKGDISKVALKRFRQQNRSWLADYALFEALKEEHGHGDWSTWPQPLVERDPAALKKARRRHATSTRKHAFWQFLFNRQWSELRDYCHEHDIQLFGDLPIYVAHDSADVWANQQLFKLDDDGKPTVVAGVPPDYFSETGQLWGNPIYRWDLMKENGYRWWIRRLSAVLDRVDILRLDHFRAFAAFWEVDAAEETAINGEWVDGPDTDLFDALEDELGELPLIAEDLGVITDEVVELMNALEIPGMKVLPFGFNDGPDSSFLPHHYSENMVAYTGTHDTDTFAGWYQSAQSGTSENEDKETADFAAAYLGLRGPAPADDSAVDAKEIARQAVRAIMGSVAHTAIFPAQDLIGLGSEARMNTPGDSSGNWSWRLREGELDKDVAQMLRKWTAIYDRKA